MVQRSEIVLTEFLPNSDKRCHVIGNLTHVLTSGDIESLALCIPCSGTQDPHFHLAAIANISSKVGKLFRGEDLTEMDLADVPVSFDDPEVLQRQVASHSTPDAVSQPQNRDTGSAPEPQSKRQRLVNDGITPDILFQHNLVVRDIMSLLFSQPLRPACFEQTCHALEPVGQRRSGGWHSGGVQNFGRHVIGNLRQTGSWHHNSKDRGTASPRVHRSRCQYVRME